MQIQIETLIYNEKTRKYLDGLLPYNFVPSYDAKVIRPVPLPLHPFYKVVGLVTDPDFYIDRGIESLFLTVVINHVRSFMVNEDFFDFELDSGEISKFEITSDQYSIIKVL